MIHVVGPGHGAPAILADLWIERSLEKFYPEYARNPEGLTKLIAPFNTSGGPPCLVRAWESSSALVRVGNSRWCPYMSTSHINDETPGAMHEVRELGFALVVPFGAVMDKPNLIVTSDGEASRPWAGYIVSHTLLGGV